MAQEREEFRVASESANPLRIAVPIKTLRVRESPPACAACQGVNETDLEEPASKKNDGARGPAMYVLKTRVTRRGTAFPMNSALQ